VQLLIGYIVNYTFKYNILCSCTAPYLNSCHA